MRPEGKTGPPPGESAVVVYQVVCLAGLALVLVAQMSHGLGLVDLLLLLVGLLGVAARLRAAPVLVVVLLAASLLSQQAFLGVGRWGRSRVVGTFQATDVVLCCGVLAYVAAHCRLQSLASYILPPDRRQHLESDWPWLVRALLPRRLVRYRRAAGLVSPAELITFLLTLPLWAVLAQVFWAWLARRETVLSIDLPLPQLRLVLVTWILVIGGVVVAAVFGEWRRRTMTPPEALQLLQDTAWRETRREQRRLQRWITWARLRRGGRKEKP